MSHDDRAADSSAPDEIEITIPNRAEYVGVARLAILGVASRMAFSYDEVEDIRLAVAEACTRSIEQPNGHQPPAEPIRLRCLIDPRRLVIEVRSPIRGNGSDEAAKDRPVLEGGDLSGVLIRILMDTVDVEERPAEGVHLLRMVKNVAH